MSIPQIRKCQVSIEVLFNLMIHMVDHSGIISGLTVSNIFSLTFTLHPITTLLSNLYLFNIEITFWESCKACWVKLVRASTPRRITSVVPREGTNIAAGQSYQWNTNLAQQGLRCGRLAVFSGSSENMKPQVKGKPRMPSPYPVRGEVMPTGKSHISSRSC